MAFLTGINEERPTRRRIAQALKRSERTVKRAFAELVEIKWITCIGGGSGAPAKITILNEIDWILAPAEPKNCARSKMAPASAKMAPAEPHIRVKVKTLEQGTTESQSDIHSLVKKNLGTWQMGGWYDGYSRMWRRPGTLPDAGTLARIAEGIGTVDFYPEFQRRALGPLQTADTWGLIVNIAREVGSPRKPMGVESSQRKAIAR